jgi:hypothetical protein
MEIYKKSVAQLFLHSALNKQSIDKYFFKELLLQKLNHLFVDIEEEMKIYEDSIASNEKTFSIISKYSEKIPEEAKFGVYCHCLQLGIITVRDEPANEFFLLLSVGKKIPFEKDYELKNIFGEMLLTFFGYGDE